MARYYGKIQGNRGETTRLGQSSLRVAAMSYNGGISVEFKPKSRDSSMDRVVIYACQHPDSHQNNPPDVLLYDGPIQDLLSREGRNAMVRKFAHDQLEESYGTRD